MILLDLANQGQPLYLREEVSGIATISSRYAQQNLSRPRGPSFPTGRVLSISAWDVLGASARSKAIRLNLYKPCPGITMVVLSQCSGAISIGRYADLISKKL